MSIPQSSQHLELLIDLPLAVIDTSIGPATYFNRSKKMPSGNSQDATNYFIRD